MPVEAAGAGDAEQHHGDRGHGVRLEQVGGHAGAVADVVADVVRDHGRVARVVLRDARLDLADEVGADVRGLRVDAAAEPREDGDERAAEGEPDQVVDRRVRRVAEPAGEDPVVAGDAEQAEADDEQAGDRAGAERDVERRRQPVRAASAVRTFERTATFIPMKPAAADRTAPMRKPIAVAPAERVVEAEQQERHDRDDRDRRVLAAQVRRGALLHGARDLLHALVACRLAEQPDRELEAVDDGCAAHSSANSTA